MRKYNKLEAFLFAVALIFFGVQGILLGKVPAFRGRQGLLPTSTFESPFVPWIGFILVLVGIYVLIRYFLWRRK